MTKNLSLWLFVGVAIFLNNSTIGQKNTKVLTLEDIYKNNLYSAKGFGAIRWMKDNAGYSTIENNASTNGNEIVRYEVNSGAKKTLVSAAQLTPTGTSTPLVIANYIWSEDNTKLLIFTNTRKVWRQNSRGDYWVLDLQTNKLIAETVLGGVPTERV